MSNRFPIDQLEKVVGKDNVRIESDRLFVCPENSAAVSQIVNSALRENFRILPLGSGSILDWSGVSAENTMVLKSERLNRVVKVVPEDLYVILQAGFPLKDLNQHLRSFDLFYPLGDGGSSGTVGGSVAANLRGKSGDRQIQTREYVLALKIVDPMGHVLDMGARTFKSVTGYDLPRLFTGSWGTLGFISQITLRLVPGRRRKDFPAVILEVPARVKTREADDPAAALSSRIKQSLDPRGIFVDFDALGG